MQNLMILCTGNSCRSQIAEGYFKSFLKDHLNIYSAGVETHGLNPKAVQVMQEDGIDISGHTSNNIDEFDDIPFDYVITVCDNARERCPVFPTTAKKFHRDFQDPAKATGSEEEIMDSFRKVRDEIKDYVREFIRNNLDSDKI